MPSWYMYISTVLLFCCTEVFTVRHARNLIWTQSPSLRIGVSRIVGIEGDPSVWVKSGEVKVRHISAPHIGWRFRGLAFQYASQTLFWTESNNKKIQGLLLNGTTETQTVFPGTSAEVDGMAVDWVSNNLYWADALYNWITMLPIGSPTAYRIIINTGLQNPHGLALYPQKGYLFWSDWGDVSKIEISDLIGNNRRVLVSTNLGHPRGLSVDYEDNKLYWVDSQKDTIECVQFNGNNRRVVVVEDHTNFFGLALYKDYLFVTEQEKGHLRIYDKNNGANHINYQLGYIPYGIIMYDESLQTGNSSGCVAYGCEHICINDALVGPTCYCGNGYKLNDTKTCELAHSSIQVGHIYAIKDAICHYPANLPDMSLQNITMDTQCFLEANRGYLALTFSAKDQTLYYSENVTNSINRVNLQQGASTEAIMRGVGCVEGMSLDWLTMNLFWTDSVYKHIMVSRADGRYQNVVIDKDLDYPLGIAVHPKRGLIFWADSGSSPKVEMSGMDGFHRRSIQNISFGSPNHVFIDFRYDMLYWSDSLLNNVKSYNIETEEISIFFSSPGTEFFGLSIYQDFLLWTSKGDMNGIHMARMDTKEKIRGILHPNVGEARDLILYDKDNQPDFESFCSSENGGCQQLCLQRSNETYFCACGVGLNWTTTGKRVILVCISTVGVLRDNFLLVTDSYQKELYQFGTFSNEVYAIPTGKHYRPIAIDYDPVREKIFWTDTNAKVIKTSGLKGEGVAVVKAFTSVSMLDGIAVDYINRLLFFTDTGLNTIEVVCLDHNDISKIIVADNLDEPRDIAAHPIDGYVYWTDWGAQPRIERSTMNGEKRETIVKLKKSSWPNGLTLDYKGRRIYWVDAKYDRIESSNFDGSNRNIILKEKDAHYFALALTGDYLYVTCWKRKYISRIHKTGGVLERVGPDSFARLNGIHSYNSSEILVGSSICQNSGCTHLCLPISVAAFVCACPDDMILKDDNKSCKPNVTMDSSGNRTSPMSYFPSTAGTKITISPKSTDMDITVKTVKQDRLHSKRGTHALNAGSISIIVIVVIVCAAIGVIAAVYFIRKRQNTIPHDKLVEDTAIDSFYRITFPDTTTRDEPTFDSGIENPAYSYDQDS
ncbi:hypothetical protein ScPMuIL_017606 [Solemya velum]